MINRNFKIIIGLDLMDIYQLKKKKNLDIPRLVYLGSLKQYDISLFTNSYFKLFHGTLHLTDKAYYVLID